MEIVVTGRNVEVPDHFRIHVTDKVGRLERYDHKIIGMQVELFHEPNRRQLKSCQRVEITGHGRGSVARAEASAGDFYAALDQAIAKLEGRLRRSHDRRRFSNRRARAMAGRTPPGGIAVIEAPPEVAVPEVALPEVDTDTDTAVIPTPRDHEEQLPRTNGHHVESDHEGAERETDPAEIYGGDRLDDPERCPGRVVRRKVHTASPMTLDDALSRMELVGHDFYLFADAESGAPSVVYRRRGYDYGVIRLDS